MEINFKLHKELNFFRLVRLYQRVSKQKQHRDYGIEDFKFELPIEINMTEEDYKILEKFFRNLRNDPEKIMDFPELKKIYEKNREQWEKYWNDNIDRLEKTKEKIEKDFEKFDLSVFDKVSKFFETKTPEKIDIIVCMGNNTSLNPSFAHLHNNLVTSFLREFLNQPKDDFNREISAIIHEIVHFCQDWKSILIKEGDMNFLEKTAACFASKGILINENKAKREGKSLKFYNTVKNAFENGKTISSIRDKLEGLRGFKYYR